MASVKSPGFFLKESQEVREARGTQEGRSPWLLLAPHPDFSCFLMAPPGAPADDNLTFEASVPADGVRNSWQCLFVLDSGGALLKLELEQTSLRKPWSETLCNVCSSWLVGPIQE